MLDVRTQVLHRLTRIFLEIPVGVVHVPEGRCVIRGKSIQKEPEPAGVRINAAGLQKQADTCRFRFRKQCRQSFQDTVFFIGERHNCHIRHMKILCRPDLLPYIVGLILRKRKVDGRIDTGDLQPLFLKQPARRGDVFRMQQAAVTVKLPFMMEIIQLQSVKMHVRRDVYELPQLQGLPAAHGKGKLHSFSSS